MLCYHCCLFPYKTHQVLAEPTQLMELKHTSLLLLAPSKHQPSQAGDYWGMSLDSLEGLWMSREGPPDEIHGTLSGSRAANRRLKVLDDGTKPQLAALPVFCVSSQKHIQTSMASEFAKVYRLQKNVFKKVTSQNEEGTLAEKQLAPKPTSDALGLGSLFCWRLRRGKRARTLH